MGWSCGGPVGSDRGTALRSFGPRPGRPGSARPRCPPTRPAFYAARRGGARDWWTLLHPPYTAWHLSYVVIGACLAPSVQISRLLATLLAFFAAVGIAAHALDELQGRPLDTAIPAPVLVALTAVGLIGAVGLGIAGVFRVGWPLVPFLVIGPVLVLAYNLELFAGRLHSDAAFAASWGAFPVLTAYVAQTGRLALAPVLAAVAAYGLSIAQRRLSTPAATAASSGHTGRRRSAPSRRNVIGARPRNRARPSGGRPPRLVVVPRAPGHGVGRGPSHLARPTRRRETAHGDLDHPWNLGGCRRARASRTSARDGGKTATGDPAGQRGRDPPGELRLPSSRR